MKIACIGWGSLIWQPGDLPACGGWRSDGPRLPVEFARISRDGRLTLIVWPGVPEIDTYWTEMTLPTLDAAIAALASREGCPPRFIGHWSRDRAGAEVAPEAVATVTAWAAHRDLQAAVWTDLPSTFAKRTGAPWSPSAAVNYLGGLVRDDAEALPRAREYIRRAPAQTRTATRTLAEQELGWLPADEH
jgi:hypothetical protein